MNTLVRPKAFQLNTQGNRNNTAFFALDEVFRPTRAELDEGNARLRDIAHIIVPVLTGETKNVHLLGRRTIGSDVVRLFVGLEGTRQPFLPFTPEEGPVRVETSAVNLGALSASQLLETDESQGTDLPLVDVGLGNDDNGLQSLYIRTVSDVEVAVISARTPSLSSRGYLAPQ